MQRVFATLCARIVGAPQSKLRFAMLNIKIQKTGA
jgi:hypothetical protein